MLKGTSFLAAANTNTGDQSGLEVLLLEPNGYKRHRVAETYATGKVAM